MQPRHRLCVFVHRKSSDTDAETVTCQTATRQPKIDFVHAGVGAIQHEGSDNVLAAP